MFCPPPDEEKESQSTNKPHYKVRRKRRKQFGAKNNRNKKDLNHKKGKITSSMSSWAESFTVAATWQLKHQMAYWKAHAKALEFENKVLHDIIRKQHYNSTPENTSNNSESEADVEDDFLDDGEQNEDGEFEVSEEFIAFLRTNAKYKEEAKKELERLKGITQEENRIGELEACPSQAAGDGSVRLKELYGANWQRIAALELSVQAHFINERDKDNTMYWPNIPFNFNFS